jgi:anti-sigma regulatory factor (Ser/Thr protein kinase)
VTSSADTPPADRGASSSLLVWVYPIGLLACAYSLLGLTFTQRPDAGDLMMRCVLMDLRAARVWSVANVEVGAAYFGVFFAMLYHVGKAARTDKTHTRDLAYAFIYLGASFALNFACVAHFRQPFLALVIGDAVVLSFTAMVSQKLWFQRLLGVFVPLVFFTCGMGHLLEGLSFWTKTYTMNVPWAMVTADVGFAVLLNAARFPGFIRGQNLLEELGEVKAGASARFALVREVLLGATQGRLRLCERRSELPERLTATELPVPLAQDSLPATRNLVSSVAQEMGFADDRVDQLRTAVSEAAMNAVIHGGGGTLAICSDGETIQVWVDDHGSGIQMATLPRATLERGYSTKGSLGHGFWLMLNMSDEVSLFTSAAGTTVVLTFARKASRAIDLAGGQTILGLEPT